MSISAAQLWLLPFLSPLWRREPISQRNRGAWGPLENERKREPIMAFPFNPKRVATMVSNLQGIGDWMKQREVSLCWIPTPCWRAPSGCGPG
ncbi:MAG TPA: hypothetical protein VGB96_11340 [Archangium sp.]